MSRATSESSDEAGIRDARYTVVSFLIYIPPRATGPKFSIWAVSVCLLLVLGGFTSSAQAQYQFDTWTADTGLPQNIVRAVHQTFEGYSWLPTLKDLPRSQRPPSRF